ncbi:MAG: MMPL family transporter, partial [Solirubrobacterales bacterium]
MFNALAGLAQRRGRIIVIAAFVGAMAAGAIGGGVADHLDPYGADDPKTKSIRADKRIEAAGFREVGLLVLVEDADVKQAATRARVEKIEQRLSSSPDVARVSSFYATGSPNFVSRKNDSTYLAVNLEATDDRGQQDAAERIAGDLEGQSGIKVGGYALAQQQVNDQVEHDLKMAEMLAFPLLFLLSLLFFRSLVAAGLPLLVGGLAIVGTFLGLRIASEFGSISIFALNLTTGLGLGLAIDYSLFIVSRYREEIA